MALCVAVAAVLLTSLSGCWDRRELDQSTHVMTAFLDLEPDGMLRVTVEVLSFFPGGGGGETGATHTVITAVGASFQDAARAMRWQAQAPISFAHVGAIVFGEDLARSGLRDILDALDQDYEIRRRVSLAVTPGKAGDLLSAALTVTRHSELVIGLLQGVAETGTDGGSSNLNEALRTLASEGKDILLARFILLPAPPIEHLTEHAQGGATGGGGGDEGGGGGGGPGHGEGPPILSLLGVGVLRDGMLVSFLEEREANGIQLLLRAGRNRRIRIPTGVTPREGFTLRTSSAAPRITVDQTDGRLVFRARLDVTGRLEEINTGGGDMALPADVARLEGLAAQHIQSLVLDGLWFCISEHDTDPAGFGRLMSRWRPDLWDQHKDRWPEALKAADIQVDVRVSIPGTGMLRSKAVPKAPAR
jgi:spore germination protein KC